MKGSKFWRWLFSPGGTTALLAFFWLTAYIINSSQGYDYLGIWPEPTIYWPLILAAIALIYDSTSGYRQWRTLHYVHVASLVFLPVLLFIWSSAYGNTSEKTYCFVDGTARRQWEDHQRIINVLIKPASILIFAAQIGFIVNIIAGFIRGKKSAIMKQPNLFQKLLRPEALLVFLAVFFYIRQLMAGKEGYDLHFHDTYYLIQWPWWFAPGPMLLLLLALVYRLTRNFRQIQSLQYFHVLSFIVVPVLTWMLSPGFTMDYITNYNDASSSPGRYLSYLGWATILVFVLGQTAFIANLAIGFIRGKKSPAPVQ